MENPGETGTQTADREERIRRRAYQIWDEAGRPDGRHDEHWHQAAADVDAEDGEPSGSAPMPAPMWPPDSTVRPDENPAEGSRRTIDRNLQKSERDAAGQFAGTQHGGGNDGVSSAEPRVLSGDESGDATFPLVQDERKAKK